MVCDWRRIATRAGKRDCDARRRNGRTAFAACQVRGGARRPVQPATGRTYDGAHVELLPAIQLMLEPSERSVREFLDDATRDLQRMRALAAQLETGDAEAWNELRNLAHNVAARAITLKLGVLGSCARELESLADEWLAGAPLDAFFVQCTSSALETVALEIETLKSGR
jgi:hypothetical protein